MTKRTESAATTWDAEKLSKSRLTNVVADNNKENVNSRNLNR